MIAMISAIPIAADLDWAANSDVPEVTARAWVVEESKPELRGVLLRSLWESDACNWCSWLRPLDYPSESTSRTR